MFLAGCAIVPPPGAVVPVARHALLNEQPVPEGRCPVFDDTSTPAGFRESLRDYVDCARESWAPLLNAVGRKAPEPGVYLEATDWASDCTGALGDDDAGMFCIADGTLVFSNDLQTIADDSDLAAPSVAFHEYAHAVQQELGMVMDTPPGDPTRRIELQASCWSAILMRTLVGLEMTEEVRTSLAEDAASGSDSDHGTPESLHRWTLIGLSATTVGECDTSRAPESEIA